MNTYISHIDEDNSLMESCSQDSSEFLLGFILQSSYIDNISGMLQDQFKFTKHDLYTTNTMCSNNFDGHDVNIEYFNLLQKI